MGTVAYYVRGLFEGICVPFDYLPPWLGLTLLGIITGIAMLWVVGKTSPQKLVARARDKMSAAILEMRLSLDSPTTLFKCQGRLLGWSMIYIGSLIPSLLILSAPLGLLYLHLDARYGLEPLPTNEPFVVHFELGDDVGADGLVVASDSEALAVTSPVVYAKRQDGKQVDAFVRAEFKERATGNIKLQLGEHSYNKRLSAADGAPLSKERVLGAPLFWAEGWEPPLTGSVQRISTSLADADTSYIGMPWWLYWLLIATIAALALKSRLDVAI